MSSYATGWAWQQSVGSSKLLLLALADLADDRGITRTPIAVLAEMIDKNPSTVYRQLNDLAALGLIERHGQKAANHTQLISVTRILTGRTTHTQKPAKTIPSQNASRPAPSQNPTILIPSQNATRTEEAVKTLDSIPSQSATRQADSPREAASQNATRKETNLYSYVLGFLAPTNINISEHSLDKLKAAVKVVVDAGLEDIWQEWADSSPDNVGTLRAQIAAWAKWVSEGHADRLREAATFILETGGYAHRFGGLRGKMKDTVSANSSGRGGPARGGTAGGAQSVGQDQEARTAGAACQPGERRQDPNGQIWTVEEVSWGEVIFGEVGAPIGRHDGEVSAWSLLGMDGQDQGGAA